MCLLILKLKMFAQVLKLVFKVVAAYLLLQLIYNYICCLQSSLRLYACVIKSINAFGKAVLQHLLEPFKVDSAFRSAFYCSVCILISLIILHTNHKASYILSYETFWVPLHFYGKDLYSTKLYWIFTGFILLGIMLFKSRKQQCLRDAIN